MEIKPGTLLVAEGMILKQGKSISVGEFVEAGLQKEEGQVSYREADLRGVKGRMS